jgi:hypothetical protein
MMCRSAGSAGFLALANEVVVGLHLGFADVTQIPHQLSSLRRKLRPMPVLSRWARQQQAHVCSAVSFR